MCAMSGIKQAVPRRFFLRRSRYHAGNRPYPEIGP